MPNTAPAGKPMPATNKADALAAQEKTRQQREGPGPSYKGAQGQGATPPPTAPPGGGGGQKTPGRGQGGPGANYQGGLNSQFGAGNPFGMQSWYGDNPLETARAKATQDFGTALGGIRSRYGSQGLGTSSREALAEGTATSQYATGLADVLAGRGQVARASDADRGLNAFLGAGQQNLAANDQLGRMGAGTTAIGAEEQNIPNLSNIGSWITNFAKQLGFGSEHTKTGSGPFWRK